MFGPAAGRGDGGAGMRTGSPADAADSGAVNTAVIGGASSMRSFFGSVVCGRVVVGPVVVVAGRTVVVDVGTAQAVLTSPTATNTPPPNAMSAADRRDRLDGMAHLFCKERSRHASPTVRPPPSGGVCSNQASPLGGLSRYLTTCAAFDLSAAYTAVATTAAGLQHT